MTLNPTRSKVPHTCVTGVHESQISLRFALRRAVFKIQAILRKVHGMAPKWHWTLQGQITLYIYNSCPWFPNFTPFCSMTNLCSRYTPFWDKGTEWPKMTLDTTRSYVPHTYVTSIHKIQISLSFFLRPEVFEIQVILRQVHRMIPYWPWTLQGQITLYMYMYNKSSWFPNFTPLRSTTSRFSRYKPFWDKCTEELQNDLNTTRWYVPHICDSYPRVPDFTLLRSTKSRFEIQAILRQCTEWPKCT